MARARLDQIPDCQCGGFRPRSCNVGLDVWLTKQGAEKSKAESRKIVEGPMYYFLRRFLSLPSFVLFLA